MELLRYIIGVILGIVVFVFVYGLTTIAKTTKPISVIAAIFWILNMISLFVFDTFTWRELLTSIFAVGAACICFGGMDDSP